MLYNEDYLKMYSETYLKNYLKKNNKINLLSTDAKEVNLNYALEQFFIKHANDNDKYINHIIDRLFYLFSDQPLYMPYSSILNNKEVVKYLVSLNPEREELYKKGINKLTSGINETYRKVMNNEQVNINDYNKMLVYFTNNIKYYGNDNLSKSIDEFANKLLNENKIPSINLEKLFLFNYASKYTLGSYYKEDTPVIRLVDFSSSDNNSYRGGDELEGLIRMNINTCKHPHFYNTLDLMIQCVCHETVHRIQEIDAKTNNNDIHALEMAIQRLFGQDEYQTGENYLFNEIEEDAQRRGFDSAMSLYYRAHNKKTHDKLYQDKKDYIKERSFSYEYVTLSNGHKVSKEKYNVLNIRKVVKQNPHLINKFPVLENLFHANGDSKSLEEMLNEEFKSYDIKKMYIDFIIYDVRRGGLDNLDLSKYDNNKKADIIKNLLRVYDKVIDDFKNCLKDTDYRNKRQKASEFLSKNKLGDLLLFTEFFDKNLEFMAKYEDSQDANRFRNLFSDFSYPMRNLLNIIDKLKEEGNLTNLEPLIKENQDTFDKYDEHMKYAYYKIYMSHFTKKERETILDFDSERYQFKYYVKMMMKKYLTRDHYLIDENGKQMRFNGQVEPHSFFREILKTYGKKDNRELNDMFEDDLVNKPTIVDNKKL